MRTLPSVSYTAIRAATRRLVDEAGGTEAAAMVTRVQKSSLSNYGSVNNGEHFIPADAIADLEHDIGKPIVTRELARLAGYELVPVEGKADPADIVVQILRLDGATADVSVAVAKMEEDGRREAHELDAVCRALQAAIIKAQNAYDTACRQRAALKVVG